MVQAFFDYRQGMRKKQSMGDCELELLSFQASKVPYDICLDIIDDAGEGDCVLHLLMRKDLYSQEQAQTLLKYLVKLAESFSRVPNTTLESAAMFDVHEIERVIDFSQGECTLQCMMQLLSFDLCNTHTCMECHRAATGFEIRNNTGSD